MYFGRCDAYLRSTKMRTKEEEKEKAGKRAAETGEGSRARNEDFRMEELVGAYQKRRSWA